MNSDDALSNALADLDALLAAGSAAFGKATTPEAVEAARVEYLGQKHGRVKAAQERLRSLEPASRREYGQRFNAAKTQLESALEAAKSRVERRTSVEAGLDVTLPGTRPRMGHMSSAHADRQ